MSETLPDGARRAVFLDRDGTLNDERGFVTTPAALRVLPGTVEALGRLCDARFTVVVVTNQSGIARGLYGEADLARVHGALHEQLAHLPAGYFHCPHHPDAEGSPYGVRCDCRKPLAGLLHQARRVLGLTFEGSYLVGDSARDLLMGNGLPLRGILVRSGKPWREQLALLRRADLAPLAVCDDLAAAVDVILGTADPAKAPP